MPVTRLTRYLSCFLLALFLSGCQSLTAGENQLPVIVKSPNDPREYKFLTLENGIKMVLVSNPGVDISAAAVGVHVGDWQNPKEWMGLAHLLEHMLFLGSQKYPGPDDFDNYISDHGGYNNAWTSSTDTVYYFSIQKEFLFPALDRLSQFFISPLMTPELLDRERHAVDSEFQIYRQQDLRRIIQVEKATTNPQHPNSRFSIGTLETLSDHDGKSLRDALFHLHDLWYTGQNMSVAIVSNESLSELEKQARSMFASIANKAPPERPSLPPIFTENEVGVRIDMQARKQIRNLSLKFPLAVDANYLREKPMAYLAHLIGHESQGSLHSFFKKKGWVKSVSAWGSDDTLEAFFEIEVELTAEGYKHIDDITEQIFAYFRLIKEEGVSQHYFDELQTQRELAFRFLERENPDETVVHMVEFMPLYPPEHLIQGHVRIPEFNPAKIHQVLAQLTPDNMRMRVVSNYPPSVRSEDIKEEPWMGMPYSVQAITQQQKHRFLNAPLHPALTLPPENPFMPNDLSVLREEEREVPELIESAPGFQSWYRHDNSFGVPRSNMIIRFHVPGMMADPESVMLFRLYSLLLNEDFNETLYLAGQAGLGYSMWLNQRGFLVEVSGFDDGLPAFFDSLLKKMKSFKVDPQKLQHEKDFLKEQLQNVYLQDPPAHLRQALSLLMYDREFSVQEKLDALENITPDDLQKWFAALFTDISITALINGNAGQGMARQLTERLKPFVTSRPKDFQTLPHIIPEHVAQPICYISYENEDASIAVVTQSTSRSFSSRAIFLLLESLLSTPFYSQLRTEEQLGYLVATFNSEMERFPVLQFLIQSPEHSPEYLGQRIGVFLKSYNETITGLTETLLQSHKDGIISNLQEPETSLSEQTENFWGDLSVGYTAFDQGKQLVQAIQKVTPEDVQKLYRGLVEGEHQIHIYGYSANKLPENLPPACNDPEFTRQLKKRES